jgi:hypothetical protein
MGLKLWDNHRQSYDCQTTEQGKTSQSWRRKVMGLRSVFFNELKMTARLPNFEWFNYQSETTSDFRVSR